MFFTLLYTINAIRLSLFNADKVLQYPITKMFKILKHPIICGGLTPPQINKMHYYPITKTCSEFYFLPS